nr:hypothetical protein Hi04_10k_c554_00029 [uncultured bacterium]
MSVVAFFLLQCFILVLSWDTFTNLPFLGSIPRLVGLAASAVGLLHILARKSVRPLSWFHLFAILFVVWTGVSNFWSIDPEATRTRFLTYLQLAVLVWLIWEIAWPPERQQSLLRAYVLGSCVAAVLTIYNYHSGDAWRAGLFAEPTRFVAMKQDPNELGLILALGIPMAWYVGLSQPHRRLAVAWLLYLPLAITAILLTASRGAVITMMVALLIIPVTLGRLRLRTGLAVFALAVGSLALAASVAPEKSLERIASMGSDIEAGSFGGRARLWRAGLEVAQEHPLVGVGAGAFGAAIEPLFTGQTYETERESSHNVLLAILVEDGVVGLLLFIAMVTAAMEPLRHLPPFQRRFSIVLLSALAVGSWSLHWDHRKQLWFVLGMVAVQLANRSQSAVVGEPEAETVPDVST